MTTMMCAVKTDTVYLTSLDTQFISSSSGAHCTYRRVLFQGLYILQILGTSMKFVSPKINRNSIVCKFTCIVKSSANVVS